MLGLDYTPNQKRAIWAIIGVAAVAISVALSRNMMSGGGEVVLREPANGSQTGVVTSGSDPLGGPPEPRGEVIVHVAGSVNSPNVYRFPAGKRIIDAINAAGGATPDADLQALNLAERLQDGSRIDVPRKGATQLQMGTTSVQAGLGAGSSASKAQSGSTHGSSKAVSDKFQKPGDGSVSINRASPEELQKLPGVGPATAQKIVDYRQQLGRFSRIEQLLDVKGIGPKKLEKMRPFVTL